MKGAFDDLLENKATAVAGLPTPKSAPIAGAFDDFMADERQSAAPTPKDKGAFTSTLKSTGAHILNSLAGQPIEDIGAGINSPSVQGFGQKVREYAEGVQKDNPSSINKLSDIADRPLDALKTAAGNIIPQMPLSLASSWAGAEAGASLGALAAPVTGGASIPVGTAIGAGLGLVAPSYLQEYTEMRGKQHETGQEDIPKALAHAVPAAAIEGVGDKLMLGGTRLLPSSIRNAAADTLASGASRLAHIGKQGLKGAVIEGGLEEYPQTWLEQLGGNQDTSTPEAAEERNVSGVLGAIGGGAMKGGVSAFDARLPTPVQPANTDTAAQPTDQPTDDTVEPPAQPAPVNAEVQPAPVNTEAQETPVSPPVNPIIAEAEADVVAADQAIEENKEQGNTLGTGQAANDKAKAQQNLDMVNAQVANTGTPEQGYTSAFDNAGIKPATYSPATFKAANDTLSSIDTDGFTQANSDSLVDIATELDIPIQDKDLATVRTEVNAKVSKHTNENFNAEVDALTPADASSQDVKLARKAFNGISKALDSWKEKGSNGIDVSENELLDEIELLSFSTSKGKKVNSDSIQDGKLFSLIPDTHKEILDTGTADQQHEYLSELHDLISRKAKSDNNETGKASLNPAIAPTVVDTKVKTGLLVTDTDKSNGRINVDDYINKKNEATPQAEPTNEPTTVSTGSSVESPIIPIPVTKPVENPVNETPSQANTESTQTQTEPTNITPTVSTGSSVDNQAGSASETPEVQGIQASDATVSTPTKQVKTKQDPILKLSLDEVDNLSPDDTEKYYSAMSKLSPDEYAKHPHNKRMSSSMVQSSYDGLQAYRDEDTAKTTSPIKQTLTNQKPVTKKPFNSLDAATIYLEDNGHDETHYVKQLPNDKKGKPRFILKKNEEANTPATTAQPEPQGTNIDSSAVSESSVPQAGQETVSDGASNEVARNEAVNSTYKPLLEKAFKNLQQGFASNRKGLDKEIADYNLMAESVSLPTITRDSLTGSVETRNYNEMPDTAHEDLPMASDGIKRLINLPKTKGKQAKTVAIDDDYVLTMDNGKFVDLPKMTKDRAIELSKTKAVKESDEKVNEFYDVTPRAYAEHMGYKPTQDNLNLLRTQPTQEIPNGESTNPATQETNAQAVKTTAERKAEVKAAAEAKIKAKAEAYEASKKETPEPKQDVSANSRGEAVKTDKPVDTNVVFTEDMANAARERLRAKLGRLNSGVDPEMFADGIVLAGYHIEKGARTFAAYAKAMVADMGDEIKPYLKQFYYGVKSDPRAGAFAGDMDKLGYVEDVDIDELLAEPKIDNIVPDRNDPLFEEKNKLRQLKNTLAGDRSPRNGLPLTNKEKSDYEGWIAELEDLLAEPKAEPAKEAKHKEPDFDAISNTVTAKQKSNLFVNAELDDRELTNEDWQSLGFVKYKGLWIDSNFTQEEIDTIGDDTIGLMVSSGITHLERDDSTDSHADWRQKSSVSGNSIGISKNAFIFAKQKEKDGVKNYSKLGVRRFIYHEIGHQIYSELNDSQKSEIDNLGTTTLYAENLKNNHPDLHTAASANEENFAETVSFYYQNKFDEQSQSVQNNLIQFIDNSSGDVSVNSETAQGVDKPLSAKQDKPEPIAETKKPAPDINVTTKEATHTIDNDYVLSMDNGKFVDLPVMTKNRAIELSKTKTVKGGDEKVNEFYNVIPRAYAEHMGYAPTPDNLNLLKESNTTALNFFTEISNKGNKPKDRQKIIDALDHPDKDRLIMINENYIDIIGELEGKGVEINGVKTEFSKDGC